MSEVNVELKLEQCRLINATTPNTAHTEMKISINRQFVVLK